MTEIWRQIEGYNNRYFISNFGNVKSTYANKERILKPFPNKCGYLMVDLRSHGSRTSISVHRLVAQTFIPNPDNLPEVNHKDENKKNNCVDNLEWCTTEYNCNYGTRNIRKGINCRKPICSVDENGNVTHYNSRIEASRSTGISDTSISKALSKNYQHNKTAGGMLWLYDDGNVDQMVKENNIKAIINKKSIYSIDINGDICHYLSVAEAYKETKINNISRALIKGTLAGGRYWFYED